MASGLRRRVGFDLASGNACRHKGPLPVDQLIWKFGDLALVEFALVGLKCTAWLRR